MNKIIVVLKGGPMNDEQVEVERGRPHIEVVSLEGHSETVLTERNCTVAPIKEYKRSLYVKSNHSDLEYIFSEPK